MRLEMYGGVWKEGNTTEEDSDQRLHNHQVTDKTMRFPIQLIHTGLGKKSFSSDVCYVGTKGMRHGPSESASSKMHARILIAQPILNGRTYRRGGWRANQ